VPITGAKSPTPPTNIDRRGRSRRLVKRAPTKAGQIRALWQDIEAALAVGQTIKSICKWLEEDTGITLGVTSLTSYISRIRRREKANRSPEAPTAQFVRSETESTLAASVARTSDMAPASGGPVPNQFDDPLAASTSDAGFIETEDGHPQDSQRRRPRRQKSYLTKGQ
jgi:hypothetical protein